MTEGVTRTDAVGAEQPTAPSAPAHESSLKNLNLRGRLARLGGAKQSAYPAVEPLIRIVKTTHPKADTSVIERAYAVAERAHAGQKRKSGDDYITHPIAVTTILAELGMTPITLAAALLHDTVEDTDYSLAQLKADFGDEIAMLVDGVTKLEKVKYGEAAQAETMRKMVIAMSKDIRVLVIKLADRLHNARTWRYVSAESAQRKAKETLEIYAPLAHRLGMNTIKWELEDLSFATLYPPVYESIVGMVAERAPAREEYLAGVRHEVSEILRAAGIRATITGRPKHYYSVYQKMIVRGREFEDIYDLIAVRVLVETVRDCYAVVGELHSRWKPMPGRFKDYIAWPKFNMYQSLHTTVIGPEGKPVEIQIRTHVMHQRAEYGVAAHWKYKSGGGSAATGGEPNEFYWLRQLLDWQRDTADPGTFLEELRYDVGAKEVFVFTPKGAVMALPAGSTTVDFAYAVHTEVGHHCIGARLNGRLVALETVLDNGDVCEVLTSKAEGAGPSRDWLTFVKSPRARSKIRQWFTKERRSEAGDKGKDMLTKAMNKRPDRSIQAVLAGQFKEKILGDLRLTDMDALYAAIGEGNVSVHHVLNLAESYGLAEDLPEAVIPTKVKVRKPHNDPGILVDGESGVDAKLALCCTPVPGDPIMGFTTRGNYVSVHRDDCVNAESLRKTPERLVKVEWSPTATSIFTVQLEVEALDRSHLLSDVTRTLSDHRLNILSANVRTGRDRVALSRFTFEMGDPNHLEAVISAVRKVQGVYAVRRVTGVRSVH